MTEDVYIENEYLVQFYIRQQQPARCSVFRCFSCLCMSSSPSEECFFHADSHMHFSCVFAVSSVKVTCRAGSFGHIGSSFIGLPGALSSKSLSSLGGASTSRGPVNVCASGGLEPSCVPACTDLPSAVYRKVCEVLTFSCSSRDTIEGESRETMEERRPSAQRN